MRKENTTLQLLKSGNACVTPSGISKAGEADMKENWIGIIGRNSTYYDGYGNGPVVDVKYGRFFICPEKKLMRGQTFEEFYEGRNVD